MSMPEFPKPNPDLTQEQALTMILSSIALEEAALSHIINAEGEKIQYVLSRSPCGRCPSSLEDVLAVNKSVTNLLEMVMQNQLILKNKMEKVLEFLPPAPPRPPLPPAPPVLPCIPEPTCPFGSSASFDAIPKRYGCGEPLLWSGGSAWDCLCVMPGDSSTLQMPRSGTFLIHFYGDFSPADCSPKGLELVVTCRDKAPIVKPIHPDSCRCQTPAHKKTVLQMPCSCSPCCASVFVRAPDGLCLRQGRISFTRL